VKGLTLIELMIGVALLTILLSVGVPGVHELIEKYQANTSVSTLKQVFMRARTVALDKEISVTSCPMRNNACSTDWSDTLTVFADINNNQALDLDEPIYFRTEMAISTGYWLKKRANSPYVKFSPQGHAFSTATTFLYCPSSSKLQLAKQLVINFQGRIRIGHYLNQNGTPYSTIAPLACRS